MFFTVTVDCTECVSDTSRLLLFRFVVATSGRPSPLKSPITGDCEAFPTGLVTVVKDGSVKEPAPFPNRTTIASFRTEKTARSGWPSLLKSPTATDEGRSPDGAKLQRLLPPEKLPLPFPKST